MESTIPNNVFMFILFTILNTILSLKIPKAFLDYRRGLFKVRLWEDGGAVYQRLFKVKQWKNILPELGDFSKTVFPKKQLTAYNKDYLEKYIVESCRAELTHWGIIFSSLLFAFWNGYTKTTAVVVAALGLNLPYVIIQRHIRPRIVSILIYTGKRKESVAARSGLSADDHDPEAILSQKGHPF